jgi:IclR family transcriptional regulator, KDG regulon repressor
LRNDEAQPNLEDRRRAGESAIAKLSRGASGANLAPPQRPAMSGLPTASSVLLLDRRSRQLKVITGSKSLPDWSERLTLLHGVGPKRSAPQALTVPTTRYSPWQSVSNGGTVDSTLLKGLRVLEHLAQSEAPQGVTKLARELDMTKSNVHRTLQTLVSAGYVRIGSGGTYECTLKVFELASPILARIDVRQVAEPFMRSIAEQTQETIHLSLLDRTEVIYLHKIESPHPVRAYSSIGGRAPAHCVASGKALLAYQEDDALKYFSDPLPSYTSRSITTLTQLRKELEQVRVRGFAINRGEWRDSVCGLAAIVRDAMGRPVASIGISGPAERLQPAALRQYSEVVVDAARALSKALGYNPIAFSPTSDR